MNINYFYLTNQITASLLWNFFVTEDNKVLRNTVALFWLFITSITKVLLLQESESGVSLVEKIWQGHSKMTFLRCPSGTHDDRSGGGDFNQSVIGKIQDEEWWKEGWGLALYGVLSTSMILYIIRPYIDCMNMRSHTGTQLSEEVRKGNRPVTWEEVKTLTEKMGGVLNNYCVLCGRAWLSSFLCKPLFTGVNILYCIIKYTFGCSVG